MTDDTMLSHAVVFLVSFGLQLGLMLYLMRRRG